jgi:dUTP pyrophosphatase
MNLKIKKLEDDALIPTRGTIDSAGYDLYSYDDGMILPFEQSLISTKISMQIPKNFCGLIWSRSGLSSKYGIETGAGVIDCDYTGEIKIILHNNSSKKFYYTKGMRIAQIIITPYISPKIIILNNDQEHPKSNRGNNGFGSTGI